MDLEITVDAITDAQFAIIVEGPPDAIAAAHVAGWGRLVLAVPGASSPARYLIGPTLAACGPEVTAIVVGDADASGDRFRTATARDISDHGVRASLCRPPDGMDLDDWRRQLGSPDDLRNAVLDNLVDFPTSDLERR